MQYVTATPNYNCNVFESKDGISNYHFNFLENEEKNINSKSPSITWELKYIFEETINNVQRRREDIVQMENLLEHSFEELESDPNPLSEILFKCVYKTVEVAIEPMLYNFKLRLICFERDVEQHKKNLKDVKIEVKCPSNFMEEIFKSSVLVNKTLPTLPIKANIADLEYLLLFEPYETSLEDETLLIGERKANLKNFCLTGQIKVIQNDNQALKRAQKELNNKDLIIIDQAKENEQQKRTIEELNAIIASLKQEKLELTEISQK